MKYKSDLLNALIKRFGFQSYLEIGTQKNVCLSLIKCNYKVGVDPFPQVIPSKNECNLFFQTTSDLYFKTSDEKFDLILIDGLHHAEQVNKDILNALKCLNKNGIIVCHDMNPQKEEEQRVPRETKRWNGDSWKAWAMLRSYKKDLQMFVVDMDEGCGIITDGSQSIIDIPEQLTYKWLSENRNQILNLITVNDFKKWLNF